jgi:hypothetical protein
MCIGWEGTYGEVQDLYKGGKEGKNIKMLKLDSLIKHLGMKKSLVVKFGINVWSYFSCPSNTHVKNEKLFISIAQDIVDAQLVNEGKAQWGKNV